MTDIEFYDDISKLFSTYKLGRIIEEPTRVSGGLMHKMFRVRTDTNTYALKWLNPSIMQRSGVVTNMINSELIANAISKHLPVVAALNLEGQNVIYMNSKYFMVFYWIEGSSVFSPFINDNHCYLIGSALGKIHSLNITIPEITKVKIESIIYEWKRFLVNGKKLESSWVTLYSSVIDKLIVWNNHINEANCKLSELLVISHRDLDPKNVMWHEDKPYIIDWEAAGYINPYQELLEVLNYWTDNGEDALDKDRFMTLLNGYRKYMSTSGVDWECVLNSGYAGMLGWLEYSLKRALGIEGMDEEEKILGAEQVFGTIRELERYDNRVKIIKGWLSE